MRESPPLRSKWRTFVPFKECFAEGVPYRRRNGTETTKSRNATEGVPYTIRSNAVTLTLLVTDSPPASVIVTRKP